MKAVFLHVSYFVHLLRYVKNKLQKTKKTITRISRIFKHFVSLFMTVLIDVSGYPFRNC